MLISTTELHRVVFSTQMSVRQVLGSYHCRSFVPNFCVFFFISATQRLLYSFSRTLGKTASRPGDRGNLRRFSTGVTSCRNLPVVAAVKCTTNTVRLLNQWVLTIIGVCFGAATGRWCVLVAYLLCVPKEFRARSSTRKPAMLNYVFCSFYDILHTNAGIMHYKTRSVHINITLRLVRVTIVAMQKQ
jgi:hypothetical protein